MPNPKQDKNNHAQFFQKPSLFSAYNLNILWRAYNAASAVALVYDYYTNPSASHEEHIPAIITHLINANINQGADPIASILTLMANSYCIGKLNAHLYTHSAFSDLSNQLQRMGYVGNIVQTFWALVSDSDSEHSTPREPGRPK